MLRNLTMQAFISLNIVLLSSTMTRAKSKSTSADAEKQLASFI